jgi:hypothetical protein
MLCKTCQKIFEGSFYHPSDSGARVDWRDHHEELNGIWLSAIGHCFICSQVWESLNGSGEEPPIVQIGIQPKGPISEYRLWLDEKPDQLIGLDIWTN